MGSHFTRYLLLLLRPDLHAHPTELQHICSRATFLIRSKSNRRGQHLGRGCSGHWDRDEEKAEVTHRRCVVFHLPLIQDIHLDLLSVISSPCLPALGRSMSNGPAAPMSWDSINISPIKTFLEKSEFAGKLSYCKILCVGMPPSTTVNIATRSVIWMR